jgi:hypothetical protein
MQNQLLMSLATNSCNLRLFLYCSLFSKAIKFDIYIIFLSSTCLLTVFGGVKALTAL